MQVHEQNTTIFSSEWTVFLICQLVLINKRVLIQMHFEAGVHLDVYEGFIYCLLVSWAARAPVLGLHCSSRSDAL